MVHPQVSLNGTEIDKGLEELMATLWSQGKNLAKQVT